MGSKAIFVLSCLLLFAAIRVHSDLQVGYYEKKGSCKIDVEATVKKYIRDALKNYPGIGAGFIRLFFHDCFVRGCDASVLLDYTPTTSVTEKASDKNVGLRGLDIIDAIKDKFEKKCPGIVSCADIIAFAARDACDILANIKYQIPGGRLDSKISLKKDADDDLPPPTMNLTQLITLYAKKGLDTEDLVVLSGAHTIGRAHCTTFETNPHMDQQFARDIKEQCYYHDVVPLDYKTTFELDSQYYQNVKDLKSVFFSDWALLTSKETRDLVEEYATVPGSWAADFNGSMLKLGYINVITDPKVGEIRKSCRSINAPSY